MLSDRGVFGELFSASPVQDYLQYLHRTYLTESSGRVATYIPELAKADPNWFGICIVTMDGHVYEVGDSHVPFTIQSISKPFVYGLGLEDRSTAGMLKKIGVEPTGDAFNSISLREETGQPFNPMINAGAIAATSLIRGATPAERFQRILDMFGVYCGRELTVDEAVYQSESSTGHRNRAIGHMLRNFGIIEEDPTAALENYFRQCAISVTCRDLAVIAGTLANGGCNPLTKKRAVRADYVENILSVMTSCGMYDYAGEWIYKVGMPAKSGVAGGILAVLPGQLGVGVFSPLLDERGNSVRGIRACDQLSKDFNLHMLNVPNTVISVVRAEYTAADVGSDCFRSNAERLFLKRTAGRVCIYELQGELHFASTEIVVRRINGSETRFDYLVLNLKRVLRMDTSACKLLYSLYLRLKGMGKKLIITEAQALGGFAAYLAEQLGGRLPDRLFIPAASDAVEICENTLLLGLNGHYGGAGQIGAELASNGFFEGLTAAEVDALRPSLAVQRYEDGVQIIRVGDTAAEIYLLTRGCVRVGLSLPGGSFKRLASFSSGVTFGEFAVNPGHRRTADVFAESEVECHVLKVEDLNRFTISHPEIGAKLMRNIIVATAARLALANKVIAALS